MPPTIITFAESARKATASCRLRNFGYRERMGLLAGFSK
jgi:hypothetical protein